MSAPLPTDGRWPDREVARPLPMAIAASGVRPTVRIDTNRSFDEFWPGRPVTLVAESIGGKHTSVLLTGWVCASTPALLVTRWSPARSRLILTDASSAGDVRVPELTACTDRPSVVVWVCPADRWRAAAASGMTSVPGCLPWPPTQLLT